MDLLLFDLDLTLIDTSALENLRKSGEWNEIKKSLNLSTVYSGIPELLKFAQKKYIIGVVTSSPRNYAETLLEHHGLNIPVVIAYHDSKRHKPHPEPIIKAIQKLSDDGARVICVGDDIIDIEAAGRAKVDTVCFASWGSKDQPSLHDTEVPYTLFETPVELLEHIRGMTCLNCG